MSPTMLITGGTGFFGKALLRGWPASELAGIRPAVLSRNPHRFAQQHPELASRADWIAGDVLKPDTLPWDRRFDLILHAAADSTLGERIGPLDRYDQIVNGTRHILDLAVETGARRVLVTSSGGVYGGQPAYLQGIPETYTGMPDPLLPGNVYGVAKRAAEHLAALYAHQHGLDVVVARCFAFVGPDLPLDVHFAIGNFIRDALWTEEIVVQGDGTAIRSYMDQRDLARWLTALLWRGKAGQAYNVGSDHAIGMAELATRVRDLLSPHKPVRIRGQRVGNPERSRYVPDIAKARRELGLDCTVALDAAIRDTAAAADRSQTGVF